MSLDLTKTGYTYTVNDDGTVSYTAACDGVLQKLGSIDLNSSDSIEAALNSYTQAYIIGLQSQQPPVPGDGVQVGQPQTVSGS